MSPTTSSFSYEVPPAKAREEGILGSKGDSPQEEVPLPVEVYLIPSSFSRKYFSLDGDSINAGPKAPRLDLGRTEVTPR